MGTMKLEITDISAKDAADILSYCGKLFSKDGKETDKLVVFNYTDLENEQTIFQI